MNTAISTGPLLRIEDLRISFRTARGPVLAVNQVSLSLEENEVLAIVGESGSGKTLTALSVLGLEPPGATVTGRVWLGDEELRGASPRRLRDIRGASIAMIFQEPMTSLNPSLTVGRQVAEVLRRHQGLSGDEARSRVLELFDLVRLPAAARHLRSYPHQLSGGMRQRVMIAMAVACGPSVLIADEPTTALDPTIEAQILGLLRDLRASLGMSVLLITHNLGVVSRMADRVAVMYAGHVLEQASTAELLASPAHPYTIGLLGAVPQPGSDAGTRRLTPIASQVPLLRAEPASCVFSPRCAHAEPRCLTARPLLLVADEPTSALDVSVQAAILNQFADLQRGLGFSCLFISHNLAVVHYLCDRIAVMQGGEIVETGPREQVFRSPSHPYTRELLSATAVSP